MPNPRVPDSTSAHEIETRRFYKQLFRWGVLFWLMAWIASILIYQALDVGLKGSHGMRFSIKTGSIVMFRSDGIYASNHIQFEKPYFLWSEHNLKYLRNHPEDYLGALCRVGWRDYGDSHAVAFPVAGFLWLWLIGGWSGDFKRIQWAAFLKSRRLIRRATILISLPLLVLFAGHRERIFGETIGCILNVRNIQQAVRSHAGVSGIADGAPIDMNEVIGPGRYLGPHARKCPGGQSYQLMTRVPYMGKLAAECPNPDQRKRLMEQNTSEW